MKIFSSSSTMRTSNEDDLTSEISLLLLISFYVAVIVSAIISNTLLLVILAKRHKQDHAISNILLGGVAVCDLCIACINMPMQLYNHLRSDSWDRVNINIESDGSVHQPTNSAVNTCKVFHYFPTLIFGMHLIYLVAVAFDRFIGVHLALGIKEFNPKLRILLMWIASILIGGIIAIPSAIVTKAYFHKFVYNVDRDVNLTNLQIEAVFKCGEVLESDTFENIKILYDMYFVILFTVFPAAVITFCYGYIIYKLWCRKLQVNNQSRRNEQNKRLTLLLLSSTMTFFLCWTPFNAVNFLVETTSTETTSESNFSQILLLDYVRLIGYLTTVINPFIYGFGNKTYREQLQETLKTVFIRSRVSRTKNAVAPQVFLVDVDTINTGRIQTVN